MEHGFSTDPSMLSLHSKPEKFEIDTGSRDNFISKRIWYQLNQPTLIPLNCQHIGASNEILPMIGVTSFPTLVSGLNRRDCPTNIHHHTSQSRPHGMTSHHRSGSISGQPHSRWIKANPQNSDGSPRSTFPECMLTTYSVLNSQTFSIQNWRLWNIFQ